MSIGEVLRTLREEKGYMQKDVADKIGIAPNTLSGYERDLRDPDPDTLLKLAKFYGTSVGKIIGEETQELGDIYLSLAEDAKRNGIHPDDIKLAIETIKALRGGR